MACLHVCGGGQWDILGRGDSCQGGEIPTHQFSCLLLMPPALTAVWWKPGVYRKFPSLFLKNKKQRSSLRSKEKTALPALSLTENRQQVAALPRRNKITWRQVASIKPLRVPSPLLLFHMSGQDRIACPAVNVCN